MTSEAEIVVLHYLGVAWNEFVKLPEQHPCDKEEFMRAIHAAQNIIGCRVAQRADPGTWPIRTK